VTVLLSLAGAVLLVVFVRRRVLPAVLAWWSR